MRHGCHGGQIFGGPLMVGATAGTQGADDLPLGLVRAS